AASSASAERRVLRIACRANTGHATRTPAGARRTGRLPTHPERRAMPRLPHRLPALLALAALGLAAGCAAPGQAQGEQPAPAAGLAPLPEDVHSYARPDEARVTHVALDLDADFEQRVLSGTATLTIAAAPGADSVVLDTRDLTIEEVTDAAGNPLDTVTGPDDPILGRPLTVMLP